MSDPCGSSFARHDQPRDDDETCLRADNDILSDKWRGGEAQPKCVTEADGIEADNTARHEKLGHDQAAGR